MADYIDRREAINKLVQCFNESDMPPYWHKGLDVGIGIISGLPSADVRENVRGKWIINDSDEAEAFYHCSECEGDSFKMWNYCPWCGADMRGEKE